MRRAVWYFRVLIALRIRPTQGPARPLARCARPTTIASVLLDIYPTWFGDEYMLRRNGRLCWSTVATAGVILLMAVVVARAGTFVAFGPVAYTRGTGAPQTVTNTFSVINPSTQYTLKAFNGGLQDSSTELVSSSVVTINGVGIVGQNNFNQNVTEVDVPVMLQGSNTISVTLYGQPGGQLTIEIVGVDNDPPKITATASPAPNASGWNNSNVTVSFICSDTTSAVTCPPAQTVTTEGASQVISGTAKDAAGNTTTTSVSLNIDKTPPTISGTISPAPNGAGWNNSNATVSFTCNDALSGVANCPSPVSITTEGANQVVSGTAVDVAGNTASASVAVNLDETPPTLSIDSPTNGATFTSPSATVSGTVSDALSGISAVICNGASGTVESGAFSCSPMLSAGLNTISVQATDIAGNQKTTAVTVSASGFTLTGSLNTPRDPHTATLLSNGTVLIAGGQNSTGVLASAELYDPTGGSFTPTGDLTMARSFHTATLLVNGIVLVAGGQNSGGALASAELYNPSNGTFTATGGLNTARFGHTATLLNNGMVLIVGGQGASGALASAELYNPSNGTFTATGGLSTARFGHTATLLNNGMVLIVGGQDASGALASAELYNPSNGTFTATGGLNTARFGHTATVLSNGTVLVAGGQDSTGALASAELYDPTNGGFTATGSLNTARYLQTATLLSNDSVLIAGGLDSNGNALSSAELYQTSQPTPAGLVSISVSPANPSISIGTAQSFTAMGTFSDNSVQVLQSVTWTSSNAGIASVSSASGSLGFAFGVSSGTATITASAGTVSGSTTLTVVASAGSQPPVISSVSPATGPLGTAVTIVGSNFGATQGSSTITFDGAEATASSWSDTSITVTVPNGAATGPVVVTVAGINSNASIFGVTTPPSISFATPTTTVAGTQVTIVGSSFGVDQGSGSVVLGNTSGTIISWTDTQIVATVASNAQSGVAQVFQNSLGSNQIPLTIVLPDTITASAFPAPNANGWNNSNVTVTFSCTKSGNTIQNCLSPQVVTTEGANQVITGTITSSTGTLSASVTLNIDKTPPALVIGSPTDGSVFSATPTALSGTVADSLSGISSLTCNGVAVTLSGGGFSCNISLNVGVNLIAVQATDVAGNVAASNFHVSLAGTLPPPSSLQVSPTTVNMVVGDTQQFTAVDDQGRPRSDATWSVSDATLASISSDSSPVLTAIAVGQVTLTATVGGVSAQAQVNILSGAVLSAGTTRWSAPSTPGFTVQQIVPAVPSAGGPGLFSIELDSSNDALVRALTTDGQQLWVAQLPLQGGAQAMADANGGVLVKILANPGSYLPDYHLVDLDAQTGSQKWVHDSGYDVFAFSGETTVRDDGTIFKLEIYQGQQALLAISGDTGATVLAYLPPAGTFTSPYVDCTVAQAPTISTLSPPTTGADGNVYSIVTKTDVLAPGCSYAGSFTQTLELLQVTPDGNVSFTPVHKETSVQTFGSSYVAEYYLRLLPNPYFASQETYYYQPIPQLQAFHVIPDGQGGLLVPYELAEFGTGTTPSYQERIAHVVGGSAENDFALALQPTNSAQEFPMVLGEGDGVYATDGQTVTAFGAEGQAYWTYTSQSPTCYSAYFSGAACGSILASTSDGGVAINDPYQGIIQLDPSGNTILLAGGSGNSASFLSHSWDGGWFAVPPSGSATSEIALPITEALTSLWANPAGNPSSNDSAGRPWYFIINWRNDFSFTPDDPSYLPSLQTDITSDAAAIKKAALQALKKAYKQWPVTVVEGKAGTGDNWAIIQDYPPTGAPATDCGDTSLNQSPPQESTVTYTCVMEQAQWALQIVINNSQDEADALAREDLIQAIGRGMGNTAAHEIAHQFLGLCCNMDVTISTDLNAAATYNQGDADGDPSPNVPDSDPASYTGFGKDEKTAIHWESATQQGLARCLASGWRDYQGESCAARIGMPNGTTNPAGIWRRAVDAQGLKPDSSRDSTRKSIRTQVATHRRRP